MQNKKNPKADIGRNSSIYFALGLALMMFLSYGTINYKVYDKDALGLDKVNMEYNWKGVRNNNSLTSLFSGLHFW